LTGGHSEASYVYEIDVRMVRCMANVVGERYQITIDRIVRRELGIKPGDLAVERVEDGRLVVEFVPAPHVASLRGIFHRSDVEPVTDWSSAKDRAWAMRSAEIVEALQRDSERHGGPR
jgi:bifunctional DNA-binding transcriptional regulator/antitoxin component of YhaV-PrlF toxin-antitoxin module